MHINNINDNNNKNNNKIAYALKTYKNMFSSVKLAEEASRTNISSILTLM